MNRPKECAGSDWRYLGLWGICALRGVFPGMAAEQDLPSGWRRATPAESSNEWREKSPTRFLVVKGDFDGDGKEDTAELFINSSSNQFALFVKLASTDKWQLTGAPVNGMWFGQFGIHLVKPGKYETACGKGYGEYACSHGEPETLKVPGAAIDFFYRESSDSYFYWDKKERAFRKILMSD